MGQLALPAPEAEGTPSQPSPVTQNLSVPPGTLEGGVLLHVRHEVRLSVSVLSFMRDLRQPCFPFLGEIKKRKMSLDLRLPLHNNKKKDAAHSVCNGSWSKQTLGRTAAGPTTQGR